MPDLLLEATGVAKRYGAVAALRAASLAVRAGEVHALMGANGAGKSTLVKILTGAVHPDSGSITVRGEPYHRPLPRRGPARRHRLRLPGAGAHPGPGHPVEPSPDARPRSSRSATGWPSWASATSTCPTSPATCPSPRCGSSTWRARSPSSPHVLMLDEMTAALPADLTERVLARHRQPARVRPLHHLHLPPAHRDRGRVRPRHGPARRRDGRRRRRQRGLRGADRRADARRAGGRSPRRRWRPRAERRARAPRRRRASPRASLRVGGRLHDVSFELRAGEVLGVAALEGQGQDELFDILAGVTATRRRASSSSTARPVSFRHPADAIRAGARVRPGRPGRGAPHAAVGAREHRAAVHRRRSGRGARSTWRPRRRGSTRRSQQLQIDTRAASEVRQLSGGNQQKVTIARWVAGGVQTMLCFDPTRGIDIGTKQQIYELVRELAAAGAAVLLLHLRAQGDPARLRPGDRHLRRADRRRDPGRGGRRADPAARRLRPAARTSRCPRRSPPRSSPRRPRADGRQPRSGRRQRADRRSGTAGVRVSAAADVGTSERPDRGDRSCAAGRSATRGRWRCSGCSSGSCSLTYLIQPSYGAAQLQGLADRGAAARVGGRRPGHRRHLRRHRPVDRLDDGPHERDGRAS